MADNLLSSRDNVIIFLSAHGKSNADIADALGLSTAAVSKVASTERLQFEIKRMQHKIFGPDAKAISKQFKEMLPAAMDTLKEIVENHNHKPQLRFSAAQEIFDRSLGKPKQTIELEGSLVKDIYDKLDALPQGALDVIDVTPGATEAIDGEAKPQAPQEKPKDAVDSWIEKNL